ncbi:MAG: hypothetical protein U5L45_23055 [Saprospiraceae bacterium]|nr:hypothetical protein [Saprospiraceae bacterium]
MVVIQNAPPSAARGVFFGARFRVFIAQNEEVVHSSGFARKSTTFPSFASEASNRPH